MRIVYNVVWFTNRWLVTQGGIDDAPIRMVGPTPTLSVNTSKFWAFLTARKFARNLHKNGELSRVVVYKKNGQVHFTISYGQDGVKHTFDRNGALVVDIDSLVKSEGFKKQIEAAIKLAEYQKK